MGSGASKGPACYYALVTDASCKGDASQSSRSRPEVNRPVEDSKISVRDPGDLTKAQEPPVVARMVVEIRSDGFRTIARGALEEVVSGQRVAIEANGTTPVALAASLAKSMFGARMLARQALSSLMSRRLKRRGE